MILNYKSKKFYIDNKLFRDLSLYTKYVVTQNEDFVLLLDGAEGAGKSKFIRQIALCVAYILETEHNIKIDVDYKNLKFDLADYIKGSMGEGKYYVNILDESRKILNRRSMMNKNNKTFTDYMSECRKFNQFHFILLPAFHDIDKYIILWRTKMFIHLEKYIDANGDLTRGEYKVYPINDQLLYRWDENMYKYPRFNPNKYGGYQGEFKDIEAFDGMDKYIELQKESMIDKYMVKTPKEKNTHAEEKLSLILNGLKEEIGLTSKQYAKITGYSVRQAQRDIKRYVDS